MSLSAALAAGPALAAPSGHPRPEDPYEHTNRRLFAFQEKLNETIVGPLLFVYKTLTPGPIGKMIHNVLTNIGEPVIIANDILQGRPKRVATDTLRLVANTTAGLLGVMDVAAKAGLPFEPNDFGVTLGRWGVPPGPYLFLPLLGPTTVRDAIGSGADVAISPLTFIHYPDRTAVSLSLIVVGGLDTFRQSEGQLETLTADAADPYATIRSVYLQDRAALVNGGEAVTPELPPLEDEPSAPESAPGVSPAPPPDAAPTTPETQPQTGAGPDAQPPALPTTTVGPQSQLDPNAPIATGRDWRYDALAATNTTPSA